MMNKDCFLILVRFAQPLFTLSARLLVVVWLVSCQPVEQRPVNTPIPTADPSIGEAFLAAINIGDFDTADQYVCPSQAGLIGQEILSKTKVPIKGMDVLGLPSPGMTKITCKSVGRQVFTCSFWAPELQCEGNPLMGESVTCTSWNLLGQLHYLRIALVDGKICEFSEN